MENLPDYNSDSLRNLILKIQREISKETWNSISQDSRKHLDEEVDADEGDDSEDVTRKLQAGERKSIMLVKRLLYDIFSNLGESLLQAEYMGFKGFDW